MIFLDNSASTYFKPRCVINAVKNTLLFMPANPARSGHSAALKGGLLLLRAREALANEFNCSAEKVIFTGGCTEALNLAIFGTAKRGGHIITTVFEHNSVLRPIYSLAKSGTVSSTIVSPPLLPSIKSAIKPNTYLIAVNAVSNVTGVKNDVAEIGKTAAKHGAKLLVDCAQSAGYYRHDMRAENISYLALSPHKGLHAPQGVGALLVADDAELRPFKLGGTGTQSATPTQPRTFPDGYESGTLPTLAIAGMLAGLKWSMQNIKATTEKLFELSSHLREELRRLPRVTVYSAPNNSGIVAFNIAGLSSYDVGDILNEQYDICVRSGLHCAPLLHKYYGTQNGGMVRASIGVDNTYAEIDEFIEAIKEISYG